MAYKKTLSILLSVMSYLNAIDPSPAEQRLAHILNIQEIVETQMEEFPVEVQRRAQDLRRRAQDFIDRMRAVEIAEEQAQE